MKDKTLLTVDVVTDDDTGIWSVGELEYGVPIETRDWLAAQPENRQRLTDWLRWLADRCEQSLAPFRVVEPAQLKRNQPADAGGKD